MEHSNDQACLERVHEHSLDTLFRQSLPVLPKASAIEKAQSSLFSTLPEQGTGIEKSTDHLLGDIAPALNGSSLTANYYGFVIGGITPAARLAESVVSLTDQNVCVHLPDQSISTNVEDKALRLLMDLLDFDQEKWSGTFSSGGMYKAANLAPKLDRVHITWRILG